MKYFSKKRFTMRQVVGLLTVVFLGITVIAYAAVTIPNTFSSGTTISSSQVNANFTAIANQMPGVEFTSSETYIAVTSTASTILSVDVTAPTAGYIIASFSGIKSINHTNGTNEYLRVELSTTCPSTIIGRAGFRYNNIPSAAPTALYYDTIATSSVFTVSAGTTTVCLVADSSSIGSIVQIGFPVLQATFVPNRF